MSRKVYYLKLIFLNIYCTYIAKFVDDVHCIEAAYLNAKQKLENADIEKENKALIENFSIALRREGAAKITVTWYLYYTRRMVEQLQELGFNDAMNKLDQNTFDRLLIFLEDERKLSPGTIRNYKKLIKKFFRWSTGGNSPKWVMDLKLKTIESPVQPSDILTKDEFIRLLEGCRHPRDKAIIAVLADSGMRIGALASCRIKNVEFNQYGAMIYLSKTGVNKTTSAKGLPLTWSAGYLNQWIAFILFTKIQKLPYGLPLTKIKKLWAIKLSEK